MALEQQRHVARAELGLLAGERLPARVRDERVVGEHVAPSRARRAQAQVVLLAVAQPERHVEHADCRRAARGGRTCRSRRPSAGPDRSGPRPRRAPRAPVRGRCRPATALFTQKRGNEQISALFENGVIVPCRGSVAAQCMIASSHPALTIVSELSSTTSARDSCMPRLAVPGEAEVALVAQQDHLRVRTPLEFAEVLRDPRIRRRVVDQDERARRDAGARARSRRTRAGRPARCRPGRRRR